LPAAIAAKVDAAVLYGTPCVDVPDDWSDGIVTACPEDNTVDAGLGSDLYDALLGVGGLFAAVEGDGYDVNGIISDVSAKAMLRGLRDTNTGMPIFLPSMQSGGQYTLGGVAMRFPMNGALDPSKSLMIAGDWNKLVFSIRQDVAVDVFTTGVVQADNGDITHNLMQEDLTALRVTFRMAWGLPLPVTRYQPLAGTRYPFAILTPTNPSP
jgi:hypothetical protein